MLAVGLDKMSLLPPASFKNTSEDGEDEREVGPPRQRQAGGRSSSPMTPPRPMGCGSRDLYATRSIPATASPGKEKISEEDDIRQETTHKGDPAPLHLRGGAGDEEGETEETVHEADALLLALRSDSARPLRPPAASAEKTEGNQLSGDDNRTPLFQPTPHARAAPEPKDQQHTIESARRGLPTPLNDHWTESTKTPAAAKPSRKRKKSNNSCRVGSQQTTARRRLDADCDDGVDSGRSDEAAESTKPRNDELLMNFDERPIKRKRTGEDEDDDLFPRSLSHNGDEYCPGAGSVDESAAVADLGARRDDHEHNAQMRELLSILRQEASRRGASVDMEFAASLLEASAGNVTMAGSLYWEVRTKGILVNFL